MKDVGREWKGGIVSKAQAESRGEGGGRECELGVEGGR